MKLSHAQLEGLADWFESWIEKAGEKYTKSAFHRWAETVAGLDMVERGFVLSILKKRKEMEGE